MIYSRIVSYIKNSIKPGGFQNCLNGPAVRIYAKRCGFNNPIVGLIRLFSQKRHGTSLEISGGRLLQAGVIRADLATTVYRKTRQAQQIRPLAFDRRQPLSRPSPSGGTSHADSDAATT